MRAKKVLLAISLLLLQQSAFAANGPGAFICSLYYNFGRETLGSLGFLVIAGAGGAWMFDVIKVSGFLLFIVRVILVALIVAGAGLLMAALGLSSC